MSAAAAIALMLLPTLSGCAGLLPTSSPSEKAARAYHLQNYQQSAVLFRSAIDGGDKRPETLYNFGTALLAADSLQNAVSEISTRAPYVHVVDTPVGLQPRQLAVLPWGVLVTDYAGNSISIIDPRPTATSSVSDERSRSASRRSAGLGSGG